MRSVVISTSSSGRPATWTNVHTADAVGVGGGLVGGAFFLNAPGNAVALWFQSHDAWQIDAFAAFGTMGSFMLAALSIVASLQNHPRAQETLESQAGVFLIDCFLHSMTAWFIAAALALLNIAWDSVWAQAAVAFSVCLAAARAALAVIALSKFFAGRFGG